MNMRPMNMLEKAEEKVWLVQHKSFGLHTGHVACNPSHSPLLPSSPPSISSPFFFPFPLLPSFPPFHFFSPFLLLPISSSTSSLQLSSLSPSQYNDLLKKKQNVKNNKSKIGELITEQDQKKNEPLQGAYGRLNKVSLWAYLSC